MGFDNPNKIYVLVTGGGAHGCREHPSLLFFFVRCSIYLTFFFLVVLLGAMGWLSVVVLICD